MSPGRIRRILSRASMSGWTVRTRVLSMMLAFMAAALAVTGVLTYAVQFGALEERVERGLWQEYSELDLIANAEDQDGDLLYTTLDELMLRVTQSAAPSDDEAVLAIIDGSGRYEAQVQGFSLSQRAVLDHVLDTYQPGSSVLTSLEVDDRELRMLIASVQVAGDDSEGIFVVASDIGLQKRVLWQSVAVFAGISLGTLLIAGWTGYLVTGRLLQPLGSLRAATEEITVEDLEYRVPVPEGTDDVTALARNFNRMLDRIQAGFAEQRRFMSDVGHELRTPLTIVRGTLEMTDEQDPDDVREAHHIALDELDRMGRVVGDLSELAASTRPDYVTLRSLDIASFARSAFARIEKIGEREWCFDGSAEVVADGDEQRLTQAVVQLAANAVRYSEPGTRIGFGVAQVSGPDGPEIHVHVTDEGMGIAPEDQLRIFERFSRADPARDSGTGLGLPIVLAIAEGHQGVVRLATREGHGSTFTLVFPQFADPGGTSPQGPSDPRGIDTPPAPSSSDQASTGPTPSDQAPTAPTPSASGRADADRLDPDRLDPDPADTRSNNR